MNRHFWTLILVLQPFLAMAQSKAPALHFFDNIPGQAEPEKSSSKTRSEQLAILFDKFAVLPLSKFPGLAEYKLEGVTEDRAWLIHRLIEHHAGISLEDPNETGELTEDLKWAAKMGYPYPHAAELKEFAKNFSQRDSKGRLEYAMTLPETFRKAFVDAALMTAEDRSLALDFLSKNPNAVWPERRSQLILTAIVSMNRQPLTSDILAKIKALSSLMDYSKPEFVCQSNSMLIYLLREGEGESVSPQKREYLLQLSKGLGEMKRRNLNCKKELDDESMSELLQKSRELRLETAGNPSTSPGALLVQVPANLSGCQIDKHYQNEVLMEIGNYKNLKNGSRRVFVITSQGNCSLQIIGQKTGQGYRARILLASPSGTELIKINQSFADINQIAAAALEGRIASDSPTAGSPASRQSVSPTAARAAR